MLAQSSSPPITRSGVFSISCLRAASVLNSRSTPSVPAIGPGTMPLTRMPAGPHSSASTRISWSMPAFAAQAWAWYMVARVDWGAEITIIEPPGLAV